MIGMTDMGAISRYCLILSFPSWQRYSCRPECFVRRPRSPPAAMRFIITRSGSRHVLFRADILSSTQTQLFVAHYR